MKGREEKAVFIDLYISFLRIINNKNSLEMVEGGKLYQAKKDKT